MTTEYHTPLGVGIIGAGGFAQIHHDRLLKLEEKGLIKVLATADPNAAMLAMAETKFHLSTRGVRTFPDYRQMLKFLKEQNAAYVTIPTPVPLHAEMHAAVIDAGMAVYLEKPPTLDMAEFERMLQAEERATMQTNVGFNFIIEPARQTIKERLLAGEFGPIERLELTAFWPRPESYYARAGWAGRLKVNGRWVLDSCVTNAVSHNVHDMLFWAGKDGVFSWARPEWVQSQLLRTYNIESTDTVFIKAGLETGAELRIGMSHAVTGEHHEQETIVCRNATIRYTIHPKIAFTITWNDGRTETMGGLPDAFEANQAAYAEYLLGRRPRPVTRLADCRAFVELSTMAFAAAGEIKTAAVTPVKNEHGVFRPIPAVGEALSHFCKTGEFPAQIGGVKLEGNPQKADRQNMIALLDKLPIQSK